MTRHVPDPDTPADLDTPLPPALAEAVRRRYVHRPHADDDDPDQPTPAASRFANYL